MPLSSIFHGPSAILQACCSVPPPPTWAQSNPAGPTPSPRPGCSPKLPFCSNLYQMGILWWDTLPNGSKWIQIVYLYQVVDTFAPLSNTSMFSKSDRMTQFGVLRATSQRGHGGGHVTPRHSAPLWLARRKEPVRELQMWSMASFVVKQLKLQRRTRNNSSNHLKPVCIGRTQTILPVSWVKYLVKLISKLLSSPWRVHPQPARCWSKPWSLAPADALFFGPHIWTTALGHGNRASTKQVSWKLLTLLAKVLVGIFCYYVPVYVLCVYYSYTYLYLSIYSIKNSPN